MRRKCEDQEMTLNLFNSPQNKIHAGNLFCKTNIYTLKYLVDKFSQNPEQLREKLLTYTNLHLSQYQDIQIETDFMNEDEIQQEIEDNQSSISLQKQSAAGKKSVKIDFANVIKDISNEEYANVMLKIIEVLGVTIETRVRLFLSEFTDLPNEIHQEIKNLLMLKTKYFYIMCNKTSEDYFEERDLDQYFKQKQIFMSCYDKIIQEIYQIYQSKLLNPKSKELIASSIQDIVQIIDHTVNSEQLKDLKINEETKNLSSNNQLTFKEQNNLIQLRDLFLQSQEYFREPLKELKERQFFFYKELVQINKDEQDSFCMFSFTNNHIFKYSELIRNSICSLANSRGGIIFFGIHNVTMKIQPITIKEISEQNVLAYLNKIFSEVFPKPSHQIKLLSVVNNFKYNYRQIQRNDYVITLTINPRKAQEIFYVNKNYEKQFTIRNTNVNQKLMSQQVTKLKEMRASETDQPNLQDYLEFNESYIPKRQSEDSYLTERKQGNEYERFSKSTENQNKYNQYNENYDSSIKRTTNFIKNYQHSQKNYQDGYNAMNKSYDQIEDNNSFRASNQSDLFRLTYKGKQNLLQCQQISKLNAWRVEILKKFLEQESTISFQEYLNTPLLKKFESQFNQLNSKNVYIFYKIDSQHRIAFKDAITQTFNDNNIDHEYIGNLYNFTIMKLEREKYQFKIENIATPLCVMYSYNNKSMLGFNFDNFEIRNSYDPSEVKEVLKKLYEFLGVDLKVNFVNNRLFVCFDKIQNFIYGYSVFIQIKKMLEQQDGQTTKIFFNLLSRIQNQN